MNKIILYSRFISNNMLKNIYPDVSEEILKKRKVSKLTCEYEEEQWSYLPKSKILRIKLFHAGALYYKYSPLNVQEKILIFFRECFLGKIKILCYQFSRPFEEVYHESNIILHNFLLKFNPIDKFSPQIVSWSLTRGVMQHVRDNTTVWIPKNKYEDNVIVHPDGLENGWNMIEQKKVNYNYNDLLDAVLENLSRKFSERDKNIFVKYSEGWTLEKIGENIGLSGEAVRQRLIHMKNYLQGIVKNEGLY